MLPLSEPNWTSTDDRIARIEIESIEAASNFNVVYSHFKRVVGYARQSDYVAGGLAAAIAPVGLLTLEKFAPSHVGRGGFAKAMRLAGVVGIAGGFLYFYQRSARTREPFPSNRDIKRPENETNMYKCSAILRSDRERTRGGDGHARDGGQGQGWPASVRREQAEPVPARRCCASEPILGAVPEHNPVVQLCQPQPARCRYGKVLPAGGKGAGGRGQGKLINESESDLGGR